MTAQDNHLNFKLNKLAPVFRDYDFLTADWHQCPADRADVEFILYHVSKIPDPLKRLVLYKAFKIENRREKNLYILNTTQRLVSFLPEKLRHSLTVDDEEIRHMAEESADRCRRLAIHHNVKGRFNKSTDSVRNVTEISVTNTSEIYRILTEYIETFRISPIEVSEKVGTEQGAIKRMCNKNWWNRRLRKIFNQAYEQAALELNLVNKYKQIYASNLMVAKRKQQLFRNEQMMSSMLVINDLGQQYSLKELSDLNVSNPAVRKAELMVRMRGFEELSKEHGHKGILITITCPSKYHANYARTGHKNRKYENLTPYQANQYLCTVWKRIRAEWNRQDIKPYGFRIAEPQHDGTPHWHILIFVEDKHLTTVKDIVSHYALQEDGDEKGALENRCDFVHMDPKIGSATGYIAKYVSKNIDGEGLDVGIYGEDPITAAQRVDAWSSCWCIRQFQQIGGASVSVWRELRRLEKSMGVDSVIEKARQAADESKWNDYINAMGGVFAKRKDQPLTLAYELASNTETGECKLGYYDGDFIKTIKGIFYKGQMIVTRFFSWRLEKAGTDFSNLEFCK